MQLHRGSQYYKNPWTLFGVHLETGFLIEYSKRISLRAASQWDYKAEGTWENL